MYCTGAFIILCIALIFIGYKRVKSLESDFKVTTGKVQYLSGATRSGGIFVFYRYSVDGKSHEMACPIINSGPFRTSDFDFLIDKSLNVIYQNNHPENSQMLFRQNDYAKHDIIVTTAMQPIIDSVEAVFRR